MLNLPERKRRVFRRVRLGGKRMRCGCCDTLLQYRVLRQRIKTGSAKLRRRNRCCVRGKGICSCFRNRFLKTPEVFFTEGWAFPIRTKRNFDFNITNGAPGPKQNPLLRWHRRRRFLAKRSKRFPGNNEFVWTSGSVRYSLYHGRCQWLRIPPLK